MLGRQNNQERRAFFGGGEVKPHSETGVGERGGATTKRARRDRASSASSKPSSGDKSATPSIHLSLSSFVSGSHRPSSSSSPPFRSVRRLPFLMQTNSPSSSVPTDRSEGGTDSGRTTQQGPSPSHSALARRCRRRNACFKDT